MEVSVDMIKVLREQTGAGIMECKQALQNAEGDLAKAEEILRARGIAKAAKRVSQETREGVIDCYIHSGNRIGAMVEVNCETDFVARTSEFRELAHHLAMQVAAMAPQYIDRQEVPEDEHRDPEEICLLQQPFIKDPTRLIQDLINDTKARVAENVRIRRFARFALGD